MDMRAKLLIFFVTANISYAQCESHVAMNVWIMLKSAVDSRNRVVRWR